MDNTIYIVGIDCAVQPSNVGIALASYEVGVCKVIEARKCGKKDSPSRVVKSWHDQACISLIAMDAPLGWPVAMSETLVSHRAGDPIAVEANRLFRRKTDCEIHFRLGKQPLDVGANFIARTAKAALALLEALRIDCGESIPLAWQMSAPAVLSAIEVYPAATLRSASLPIIPYKKSAQVQGRREILDAFPKWFDVSLVRDSASVSADVLDAILCVYAGVDFMEARCIPPTDMATARKEGWIWAGKKAKSAMD